LHHHVSNNMTPTSSNYDCYRLFQPHIKFLYYTIVSHIKGWTGSSVGISADYGLDGPGIECRWGEIFRAFPDRHWGPPSLLYNGHWVFSGGKVWPGRAADHSPPSSAEVMEE
jgi:hypothetical protein